MKQAIIEQNSDIDVLDWLLIGTLYQRTGQEEVAFQCFYMAHLLDPERIHTNANMQFETAIDPSKDN